MKRALWWAGLLGLAIASCAPPAQEETSTDEEAEEFDGETVGGGFIPEDVPVDPPYAEPDAGDFVVDTRCCEMTFTISDNEPVDATGRVVAPAGPFADGGLSLVRDGGSWSASACVPLNFSSPYWYEFSWSTPPSVEGMEDAGTEGDGGSMDAGSAYTTTVRVSSEEPKDYDGHGNEVNFIHTESSCPAP